MAVKCQAIAKNGRPCAATAVAESGLCAWHAPEWAERRRAWSQKGGANRSNTQRARKAIAEPMMPAALQTLLGVTLRGVIAGRIEPGVGNAAANLGRALVAIREATTIEDRIVELERSAGVNTKGWTA